MCAKITQNHETKEGRVKNTLEKGKNAYLSIVRPYPDNHAPIPQTIMRLYPKQLCAYTQNQMPFRTIFPQILK